MNTNRHALVVAERNTLNVWKTTAINVIWQIWVFQEFGKFGAKAELVDVGTQTLSDGSVIPLPPILLGTLGNDPQKKTLLVYGHMDVQPALKVCFWKYIIKLLFEFIYWPCSEDIKFPKYEKSTKKVISKKKIVFNFHNSYWYRLST